MIKQKLKQIKKGELTAEQNIKNFIDKINKENNEMNIVLHVNENALKEADYISIHIPLNNDTKGLIDEKAFDIMKPNAILINTSRGPVINEGSLINALKNKKINSAGLDVHCSEPLEKDNRPKTPKPHLFKISFVINY